MKRKGTSRRRNSKAGIGQPVPAVAPKEAAGAESDVEREWKWGAELERRAEGAVEELTNGYVAGNRRCLKGLEWVGYGLLARLSTLAHSGEDHEAARALAFVVRHGVRFLDKLADAHPELLQNSAGLLEKWPGFLSVDRVQDRESRERIARLEVGMRAGVNYEGKTWSRATAEVEVALALRGEVNELRYESWLGEDSKKAGWSEARAEALALAEPLEPLWRGNCAAWWKAAEPLFMEKYGPAFEDRSEFKHYWGNVAYKGEKNARALIRRDIKAKIKQAFRSIAPKKARPVEFEAHGGRPPKMVLRMAEVEGREFEIRAKMWNRECERLAKRVRDLKQSKGKATAWREASGT